MPERDLDRDFSPGEILAFLAVWRVELFETECVSRDVFKVFQGGMTRWNTVQEKSSDFFLPGRDK